MRTIVSLLSLLSLASLVACAGLQETNPADASPVVRTDFTDEAAWKQIQREVAGTYFMGFSASVWFLDDKQYSGLSGQELLQRVPGIDQYGCVFVADSAAMTSAEHHLLVLDPFDPAGKTFRVIPSEAWGVENNLRLANMDYSDFADHADPDGVFRGFK